MRHIPSKIKFSYICRSQQGIAHLGLVLIVLAAFTIIGIGAIISLSHKPHNSASASPSTVSVYSQTGCELTGRTWDANSKSCSNTCKDDSWGAITNAKTSDGKATQYCDKAVVGTISEDDCQGLHRIYIQDLGCATVPDGKSLANAPQCVGSVDQAQDTYVNYVADDNGGGHCTDTELADTSKTSTGDTMTEKQCKLLGRQFDSGSKTCASTCSPESGTLMQATDGSTFCENSVNVNITQEQCGKLHRVWLKIGCAREPRLNVDVFNAYQCETGYTYYNANSTASPSEDGDVCEVDKDTAQANEQKNTFPDVELQESAHDNEDIIEPEVESAQEVVENQLAVESGQPEGSDVAPGTEITPDTAVTDDSDAGTDTSGDTSGTDNSGDTSGDTSGDDTSSDDSGSSDSGGENNNSGKKDSGSKKTTCGTNGERVLKSGTCLRKCKDSSKYLTNYANSSTVDRCVSSCAKYGGPATTPTTKSKDGNLQCNQFDGGKPSGTKTPKKGVKLTCPQFKAMFPAKSVTCKGDGILSVLGGKCKYMHVEAKSNNSIAGTLLGNNKTQTYYTDTACNTSKAGSTNTGTSKAPGSEHYCKNVLHRVYSKTAKTCTRTCQNKHYQATKHLSSGWDECVKQSSGGSSNKIDWAGFCSRHNRVATSTGCGGCAKGVLDTKDSYHKPTVSYPGKGYRNCK